MKNRTKLLSVILTLALLLCAFPVTASATEYTPSDGETMDISACKNGDVITIGAGRSVTLDGKSVTLTNIRIICEAGVNLTLRNVVINNNGYLGVCPLTFTGAGSKLNLENGTVSALTGGATAPGISVEALAELALENNGTLTVTGGAGSSGSTGGAGLQCPKSATLTVSGGGALNATGGMNGGAGIGGTNKIPCGSITIKDGTVTALGSGVRGSLYFSHGIDGGVITISGGTVKSANINLGGIGGTSNEGSFISITGGTVTATAREATPGIGGTGSLGCDVTITGGTVIAANSHCSPIGRSIFSNSYDGKVVISGGTVTAQSYGSAFAGIEGSYSGSGTVTITGGTVTATGFNTSAGIRASGAGTGTVTISGGTVTATGGVAGAGIRGSDTGTGSVTVSGGTVTATGAATSTGICGSGAGTGSVAISDSTVYTGGGTCDLGSGLADTEETLSIGGTAMVFLQNNNCTTPTTTTHTNFTYPIGTAEVFGTAISLPSTWTTGFGAYLRSCTLSYDVNGGDGAAPDSVTRLYGAAVTLSDGSGLSLANYHFDGWNTAADGRGDSYAAGGSYTLEADTTLYAKWAANAYTVSYDANGGTVTPATQVKLYGSTYGKASDGTTDDVMPIPAWEGHAFTGWYTAASGGTKVTDSDTVSITEDTTFYAHWETKSYISSAAITMAAAVAGAAPQTAEQVETATANADYTVSNVVWNEALTAENLFKAGQVYTATVTLTSKNGKEFQTAAFTPAVAGSSSVGTTTTTGTGTGNTASFTVTFPATAAQSVTGIAVKTQPARLTYTEGETLDLSGLAATLTYNDGATADVAFAQFADNSITASPANGTVLSVSAHDGNPVTLTCNGQEATTSNLAVSAATPSAPGAPTIQSAIAGDGYVNITWSGVAGSTGYKVYASTTPCNYSSPATTVAGAVFSCDVTGLTNGTTYYFVVKASNDGGDSAYSNEISATPQVEAPGAPVLQSASAGDGYVNITWSGVAGSTGYKVYASATPGNYSLPATTVAGAVFSCDVTGLTNGRTYYFAVKAINPGGDSAFSNEVSAMPKAVPGAPVTVTAAAGNRKATVSFTAPADNGGRPITGYVVTSSPGNITAAGTGTTITVTGLTNGTAYTFTVKAVNEVGNGPESATSNAVTPHAASGGENSNSTATQPETQPPANSGVVVLVNGRTENVGTATTTNEGNTTVTTITVDSLKLEQKLAAEGNHAVVTISVKTKSDIVVGELNGQMVKNMENKQAILELKTENATYTLPAQQINISAIANQLGSNVELKDIKVQVEISKAAAGNVQLVENSAKQGEFSIMAPPVEFSVRCTYGAKTVEVSSFNAYVERTIAIPEGINPDKITTGVIVDPDGTTRHVPTRVTVIDGKYYAVINSLTNSLYSVVWHPMEFKDVANHWAKEAVNDMGSRMVIGGVGNDMFEPDRYIMRAEFAAIVVRALGLKPGSGSNPFTDVSDTAWYCDYIKTAVEYKLISGYDNGKFGPNDKITREQAMTIIARAMNITGLKAGLNMSEFDKLPGVFTDVDKASDYAKNAIAACVGSGVVSGRSDKLIAPKDSITRAEVAVIVQRLLRKSGLI